MARPAAVGRMAVASALLLLAIAAPLAAAQADTTGKTLSYAQGFTFGSNVAGYLLVSKDVCDIKDALGGGKETPDFEAAYKIYSEGKNSVKSNGAIRTLEGMATEDYNPEPFWALYTKYFGTSDFLDDFIMLGVEGDAPITSVKARNETLLKGIEANLQFAYLMHEMDEAADKIRGNQLSKESGAPHNVDEVWALYAGESPACSLWGVAQRRGADFGTLDTNCISKANTGAVTAVNNAYRAAEAGNAQSFRAAYADLQRWLVVPYIQATLRYASLLDQDLAAGRTYDENQAEGYAFFRTIEPLVAKASNTSAATIKRALWPGNAPAAGTFNAVQAAFEDAYPGLGVTASDIGSYGNKQPGLQCDSAPAISGQPAPNNAAGGAAALAMGAAGAALAAALLLLLP